jgi:hypothetical protein
MRKIDPEVPAVQVGKELRVVVEALRDESPGRGIPTGDDDGR